ncbi:MAG: hypothetical protein HQK49_12990 [Oligoflexia bacterium]|nr:hypothetical protein [Oligoflexia bacterium]
MVFKYLPMSIRESDAENYSDSVNNSKMISDIRDLLLKDSSEEAQKRANSVQNWAESRIREFWFSRMVILKLLQQEQTQQLEQPEQPIIFSDLNIVSNRSLKEFPNYLVSISHTTGMVVSGIANVNDIFAFGLDIERADRRFSENTERMFKNKFDDDKLELIKLWISKEAAYKALDPVIKTIIHADNPHFAETFDLKKIWIRARSKSSSSDYSFGICDKERQSLQIGFVELALIRNLDKGVRYYFAKATISKRFSLLL